MKRNYSEEELRKRLTKYSNERIQSVYTVPEQAIYIHIKDGFKALWCGEYTDFIQVNTLEEMKKATTVANFIEADELEPMASEEAYTAAQEEIHAVEVQADETEQEQQVPAPKKLRKRCGPKPRKNPHIDLQDSFFFSYVQAFGASPAQVEKLIKGKFTDGDDP